jgi:hypothetical protein
MTPWHRRPLTLRGAAPIPAKDRPEKIPMSFFGVTVAPKKEWPFPHVNRSGRYVTCRTTTKLKTVQGYVYADIVEKIKEDILRAKDREEAGLPFLATKSVELVFVDGVTWIIDGHHTLAAYRSLDLPAPCFFYDKGAERISAPRLFAR